MKLMQRFRKQASREDVEAQAAQELDAAMARPVDIPAMTPAPGLPGDDLNGSAGAGETPGAADTAAEGENGEAVGLVVDLPKRRPATARKTGARKPPAVTRTAATRSAGSKTGAGKAKPAAGGKAPVRKPAAKKATASSAGGTVKKRASASGAGGTAERASSARRPAAKKR